jgi:hypothetical protein
MFRVHAGVVDYAILAVYFASCWGIGLAARRQVHTGLDFFLSGRSLPAWITGLAFIAAKPGRPGNARAGRQRRQVRGRHRPLLLDRGDPGDGVPRHRDDALLLQLQGPQRPRVPAAALQRRHPRAELAQLRGGHRPDRRGQPVRHGPGHPAAARLADPHLDRAGRRDRAHLHHPGRAVLGHLQRGAAVLRHPGRPGPAHHRRPQGGRRLGRPPGQDQPGRGPRPPWPCTPGRAPGSATSPTRSGPTGSRSCSAWASCSPSATGRPTSPRSSGPLRPRTCPRPGALR